jgi:hypothetical protein
MLTVEQALALQHGQPIVFEKSDKVWFVDHVEEQPAGRFAVVLSDPDNPANSTYFTEAHLAITSIGTEGPALPAFPSVKDIKAMCKDAGVKYADLVFERPLGDEDHYSWQEVQWAVWQAHVRLEAPETPEIVEKQAPVVTGEPDSSTIQPTPAESPVEPSETITIDVNHVGEPPAQDPEVAKADEAAKAPEPPAEGVG